jgi:hypothetical protein
MSALEQLRIRQEELNRSRERSDRQEQRLANVVVELHCQGGNIHQVPVNPNGTIPTPYGVDIPIEAGPVYADLLENQIPERDSEEDIGVARLMEIRTDIQQSLARPGKAITTRRKAEEMKKQIAVYFNILRDEAKALKYFVQSFIQSKEGMTKGLNDVCSSRIQHLEFTLSTLYTASMPFLDENAKDYFPTVAEKIRELFLSIEEISKKVNLLKEGESVVSTLMKGSVTSLKLLEAERLTKAQQEARYLAAAKKNAIDEAIKKIFDSGVEAGKKQGTSERKEEEKRKDKPPSQLPTATDAYDAANSASTGTNRKCTRWTTERGKEPGFYCIPFFF